MKTGSRSGRWMPEEDEILRELALANGSPFDIATQLKRSLPFVRARAHRLGIPLGFILGPADDQQLGVKAKTLVAHEAEGHLSLAE